MAIGCASARAETIPVTIKGFVFSPAEIHAQVGDTIQWTNQDFVAHTATARDGQWDLTIQPKKSASQVLSRPGTVDYYCRFHPNMKGSIVVAQK